MITPDRIRCGWAEGDPLYEAYHDEEWGLPVHDDRTLFEYLILEGAQAGLSWITVLRKRESYREAFANFDPEKVAWFSDDDVERILQNPGVIRNRAKVISAVKNAAAFMQIQNEFGSFDRFLWQFVGGSPIVNHPATLRDIPAQTPESEALSKELRRRGFNFVGPTICYAFMQAVGLVNDHIVDCFRYRQLV